MIMLTPRETLELLKAARKRSARDWAMILLAYRHGLRASEVCGIRLADVDLKTGSISIRRLKGSLTPYSRSISTAANHCSMKRQLSEPGCASAQQTAPITCSALRGAGDSIARSSFAASRRLPKRQDCQ